MIKRKRNHDNKGFTLVELIITIAIIAVLASVVGLFIIHYLERSRIAVDVHNAALIRDALNVYPFPSDFQGRVVNYTDPETECKTTSVAG